MRVSHGLVWLLTYLSCVSCLASPPYDASIDAGKQGKYPLHPKFQSSSIRAPYVNFATWNPECDDGAYYFVTPRGWKVNSPGPMVLDSSGQLIWSQHFDNDFGGQAYDLKVQRYQDEDYLTFWLGDDTVRGHGSGEYYMLNSSYDVVQKISAANGLKADLHDFVITPEGAGLLTIFKPTLADTKAFGRKYSDSYNQAVYDGIFQEIDLKTGKALFEWRASEHLNMSSASTYKVLSGSTADAGTRTNPFDWFHINSVAKDELGNYLISARNTHAIYCIDGRSSEILWTLGGKQNSFQDLSSGHVLNFAWQHDVRFVAPDAFPESYMPPPKVEGVSTQLLTIFDNAAMDFDYSLGPPHSRALLLEISYPTSASALPKRANLGTLKSQQKHFRSTLSEQDLEKVLAINGTDPAYTVRIVREYVHPQRVRSGTQGNTQLLVKDRHPKMDPSVFVGYGINAAMTTFSGNSTVLCDAHFGARSSWAKGDVQSYRAFKFPWIGKPSSPPSVVVKRDQIYVSWNGATEVNDWVLECSQGNDGVWKEIARVAKLSFETVIQIPPSDELDDRRQLRAIAMDRAGKACEHGISDSVVQGDPNISFKALLELEHEHRFVGFGVLLVGSTVLVLLLRKALRFKRVLRNKTSLEGGQRID